MSLTTGINSIDSLVYSSWNAAPHTPVTLTYSFMTRVPTDASADDRNGFRAMTAAQQSAVRDALDEWASVANITFVQTAANTGNLQFGTNIQEDSAAYAYLPRAGDSTLAMYLNNQSSTNSTFTAGSYGPSVLIHEIGHLLGLKHPGDYDANGTSVDGPFLPDATDNNDYTQMSYDDPTGYAINRMFPTSTMLYDIQAIQYLYGANLSYHTGADAYKFTSNIAPQCVWDAGGTDTFDFSSCTGATIINLNAGAFSETARGLHNISIAYDVTIESAIAGSGGSTIYANAAGNTLTGGAGIDVFYEGSGSDTIAGGAGSDTVVFGRSFASYGVVRDGDTVRVTGDGTDVLSGVETLRFADRTLAVQDIVALLTQGGTAGNDVIAAAAGDLRIDGGAGRDTVVFAGARVGYGVVSGSDGYSVTDGAGSTDYVVNVERLRFADSAVALDVAGAPGQLYRLYEAAFNRAPDTGGMGYWIAQMDAGASLGQVAQAFAQSPEYLSLYGQVDNGQFLAQLYQNALGRTYDQGGYEYWLGALASGVSRGDVVTGFSESPELQAALIGTIRNGIDYVPYG